MMAAPKTTCCSEKSENEKKDIKQAVVVKENLNKLSLLTSSKPNVIIREAVMFYKVFTKLQSHLSVKEDEVSFGEEEFAEWGEQEETNDVNLVKINSPGSLDYSRSERVEENIDDYDVRTAIFYSEVMESLQRGIDEKVNSEDLILEIYSSKLSNDVDMKDVNTLLIKVILRIPLINQEKEMSAQEYLASMKTNLLYYHPLVHNFIQSGASQLECLSSVEDFMKENKNLHPAGMKAIYFWYNRGILNEAVIHKWYRNISPENEDIKNQASPFIKWLQEADEESSDDE